MNIGGHVSFWIMVSSGYPPKNGIVGSKQEYKGIPYSSYALQLIYLFKTIFGGVNCFF